MNIITIIARTSPIFMRIAPIIHAIQKTQIEGKIFQYRLAHTCQYYDQKVSETFFEDLNITHTDVNLGCGGQKSGMVMKQNESWKY